MPWAQRGIRTVSSAWIQDGATSIVRTTGNPDGHVVLRGGRARTNYDAASIRDAEATL